MKKFFLVWNKTRAERGGWNATPTFQHKTYRDAEAEAKRLAQSHPNEDFVVLTALTRVANRTITVEQLD